MQKILFITGTDTGVGKTLLTALLLCHLRESGGATVAMKPFCSGTREDAELLQSLQKGAISLAEMNPFYFQKPLAPWVAAKKGQKITLPAVLSQINQQKKRRKCLLVEGSGGVLVPLGEGFMVVDLIKELNCPAVVVARNRLGTINHTLMTVKVMQDAGIKNIMVVVMNEEKRDFSAKTNVKSLQKLLPKVPVFELPFVGRKVMKEGAVRRAQKKVKKTLAQVIESANLSAF